MNEMLNDMLWVAAGAGTAFLIVWSPVIAHLMAVGIVWTVNRLQAMAKTGRIKNFYMEQGHRRELK